MIQTLHYASKALPHVAAFRDACLDLGWRDTAVLTERLLRALSRGEKFLLPEHGSLFDRTPVTTDVSFRLPFPETIFEYSSPPDPEGAQDSLYRCFKVPKRLVACWETGPLGPDGRERPTHTVVWPVDYFVKKDAWQPSWVMALIPHDQRVEVVGEDMLDDVRRRFRDVALEAADVVPIAFKLKFQLAGEFGEDAERIKREAGLDIELAQRIDMGSEIRAVVQALMVLACHNVGTEVIPAPPRLNKRRLREGKVPIFDYRVLVLGKGHAAPPSEGSKGHHAAPRTHLRRGHIRNLGAGRTTWVSSCVVNPGSKAGVVVKDYAVAKPGRN